MRTLLWQDNETQRLGRGTDPIVERKKSEVRNRCLPDQCAGKMKGVESSDRLHGERESRSPDHVCADPQNMPLGGCLQQATPAELCFSFRNFLKDMCTNNDPITFGQSEVRCENHFCLTQLPSHRCSAILPKQPGKNGARFRVKFQRDPRSSSSRLEVDRLRMRGMEG